MMRAEKWQNSCWCVKAFKMCAVKVCELPGREKVHFCSPFDSIKMSEKLSIHGTQVTHVFLLVW